MAVKNVVFKITADTLQINKQLDVIKRKVNAIEKAARDAATAVGNIGKKSTTVKITANVSQLNNALTQANNNINRTTSNLSKLNTQTNSLGNSIKGAALAFAGFQVGSQLLEFGKAAVEGAVQFERLNVSLTTFLGSREKAQQLIQEIEEFAVATPFTSTEIQSSAKILLAYGVEAENLVDTLRQLGDVSSAGNASLENLALAFGQVASKGKLQGEEIRQLVNAGFNPLQEIAELTGESMATLAQKVEKGEISFALVQEAFRRATSEGGRFFKLTEQLSQSLGGRISTLVDKFEIFRREIGQLLAPAVSSAVEGLIKFFDSVKDLPNAIERNKTSIALFTGGLVLLIGYLTRATQAKIIDSVYWGIYGLRVNFAALRLKVLSASARQASIAQKALAVSTTIATSAFNGLKAAFLSNPFGIIAFAVTELIFLFSDFGDEVENSREELIKFANSGQSIVDSQKQIRVSTKQSAEEINKLFDALINNINSEEKRSKILDDINKKFGINIDLSGKEKDALEKVIAARDRLLKITAAQIKQTETQKNIDAEIKTLDDLDTEIKKVFNSREKLKKQIEDERKKPTAKDGSAFLSAKELGTETEAFILSLQSQLKALEEELPRLFESRGIVTKRIDILKNQAADAYAEYIAAISDGNDKASESFKKFLEKLREFQNELDKLDLLIKKRKIEIRVVTNLEEEIQKIKDLADVDKELLQLELDNEKLKIEAADFTEKQKAALKTAATQEFNKKVILLEIDTQEEISDITEKYAERNEEARLDIIETNIDRRLLLEDEYFDELKRKSDKISEEIENAKTKAALRGIPDRIKQNLNATLQVLNAQEALEQEKAIDRRNALLRDNTKTPEEQAAILAKSFTELEGIRIEYDGKRRDAQDLFLELFKQYNDKQVEIERLKKEAIEKLWQDLADNIFKLLNEILNIQIANSERAINNQRSRIDQAKDIAEQGNAELLQLEEERLNKLIKQREKFVRQQQALALIQLTAESTLAIAKAAAQGGVLAPLTIASTLIALAAGFAQAKAQAAQAVQGFATGGYTGDGSKYETAGVVHKGEFVFNKETTSRHRKFFEDIHKGRDPYLSAGMGQQIVVLNNYGVEERLSRIEKAITSQDRMSLTIDESGIHGLVSHYQWKNNRIRNKTR